MLKTMGFDVAANIAAARNMKQDLSIDPMTQRMIVNRAKECVEMMHLVLELNVDQTEDV